MMVVQLVSSPVYAFMTLVYLWFSGSAVAGQNSTYIPHKGVFSPAEKTLYVSYSNGGGPYDGTLGKDLLWLLKT